MKKSGLTSNSFEVGVVVQGDATQIGSEFRASQDNSLVTTDGHGRWYEPSSRFHVYSTFGLLTGATVTDNAPPAAGTSTVLSILNPVGSGYNLEILQGYVIYLDGGGSSAPGNGFWAWCAAGAGVAVTAAPNIPNQACLNIGQGVARVTSYAQKVLTNCPAHYLVRPFPMSMVDLQPGAVAQRFYTDNVDGALVVPPGFILSLAPADVKNAFVASAGIMWREVPRTLRNNQQLL